jgi:hypothetical protein
LFTESGRI